MGDALSVLDIAWLIYAHRLSLAGYPFERLHPHVFAWKERLSARPEFAKEIEMLRHSREQLEANRRAQEAGRQDARSRRRFLVHFQALASIRTTTLLRSLSPFGERELTAPAGGKSIMIEGSYQYAAASNSRTSAPDTVRGAVIASFAISLATNSILPRSKPMSRRRCGIGKAVQHLGQPVRRIVRAERGGKPRTRLAAPPRD